MKRKNFIVSIIFLVAVFLLTLGCATGKRVSMDTDEILTTLAGTWTNSEYNKTLMPAKYVMKTDGSLDLFLTETSDVIAYRAQYIFDDVWRDSKGNIWYKAKFEFDKGAPTEGKESFYELEQCRLSTRVE